MNFDFGNEPTLMEGKVMLRTPRNKPLKFLKGAALAAAAFGTFSASALAQDSDDESQLTRRDNFQDWVLTCVAPEGKDVCQIVQAFVNTETKNMLMRIQVRKVPDGPHVMIITLPLGVDLRKGGALRVAEGQVINNLTYTMCLADGCRMQFPLNDDVLAAMRAATDKGDVIFGRPNAEKNIGIPVSFAGFSEAYDALVATE